MGLTSREVKATVDSGLQKGMENPRTINEPSGSVTIADKSEPPRPLVREIPPGGEYPVEALGSLLGDAVRAVMDMVQVPPALAAGSVLAVASLATQGFADVNLPIGGGHQRPLSLYIITVADSSERKSTADNFALRAVKGREVELEMIHKKEMAAYLREKLAYDKTRDAAIKLNLKKIQNATAQNVAGLSHEISELGNPPEPPLIPYLTVQEPTIEALLKLLLLGRSSLGLFTAEGGQMIGGYAMHEDRKLSTLSVLSTLWDGDSIKRIRIIEGNSSLRGKRLALHLMMQPIVACKVLSDPEIAGQGLLSRMLVAAPGSLAGTRFFRDADQISLEKLDRFEVRIRGILSQPLPIVGGTRNELNPKRLSLSPAAKSIWTSFHDEIEADIGGGRKFEFIKSFGGKLAEHAGRIAGILTLIANFDATEVSPDAMENGCKLARFYADEALRLFCVGLTSPELAEAQKLLDWLHKRGEELICLSDIYQRGPNSIRDQVKAKPLVRILVEHGWLIHMPNGAEIQGKFHREVWRIMKP